MSEVPPAVLEDLNAGRIECSNLMEWLATDMSGLARHVSKQIACYELRDALVTASAGMEGASITRRLVEAGRCIAGVSAGLKHRDFDLLARHRSDIVRQWACYAVNEPTLPLGFEERLKLTEQFADDPNMTVREAAWMSFRPHVAVRLAEALVSLRRLVESPRGNLRRFAVEVTRPRSVWGGHIPELKRNPALGESLLSKVMNDDVRYVQLAVGNWINDASKTRPDWAAHFCAKWDLTGGANTSKITRRGLRSIKADELTPATPLFGPGVPRRKENA